MNVDGEYIEIVPPPKRVIQIIGDPGYETMFLYSNGEVWRWYWVFNPDINRSERVWEKVETP